MPSAHSRSLALWSAVAAAVAAATPPLGRVYTACDGEWVGAAPDVSWRPRDSCAPDIATPDDARARLAGRTVSFVGDSTTREMVYDVALWMEGCDAGATAAAHTAVCDEVRRLRTVRNVPSAAFVLTGAGRPPLTLAYFRVEQMRTLRTKPWYDRVVPAGLFGSALVLNAGLWNLKHDRVTVGPDPALVRASYLQEVDEAVADLGAAPAAARLRSRLLWRGLLPIEHAPNLTSGAFTRASVREAGAGAAARFAAAGFATLDAWSVGVHADFDAAFAAAAAATTVAPAGAPATAVLRVTRDGVHFPAVVNVRLGREVLSAVARRLLAEGDGVSVGGGAVSGGGDGSDTGSGGVGPGRAVAALLSAIALFALSVAVLRRRAERVAMPPRLSPAGAAAGYAHVLPFSARPSGASGRALNDDGGGGGAGCAPPPLRSSPAAATVVAVTGDGAEVDERGSACGLVLGADDTTSSTTTVTKLARLLLHAAAAAAALASVLVVNEASGSVRVSVCGTALQQPLTPHATAAVDVGCGSLQVALVGQASGVNVSVAGLASATVLVTSLSATAIAATALPSATDLLPNAVGAIDTCALRVLNGAPVAVNVAWGSSNCVGCMRPPAYLFPIAPGAAGPPDGSYNTVPCAYPLAIEVAAADAGSTYAWPAVTAAMWEHGSYTLIVSADPGATRVLPDIDGQNSYEPIAAAAFILVALGALRWLVGWLLVSKQLVRAPASASAVLLRPAARFFGWDVVAARVTAAAAARRRSESGGADGGQVVNDAPLLWSGEAGAGGPDSAAPAAAPAPPPAPVRIRSIDTLRGCCLAIMIFVNYGGGGYAFFDHSWWNGLTVADLVFPIFVWTQGVSLAISFSSMRRRGATPSDMLQKVASRSAKLFALGLFLNNGSTLSEWRILGVLQYFAVAYLVVGSLESLLPPAAPTAGADGKAEDLALLPESLGDALWHDVGRHWAQWAVMVALATVYLSLQAFMPLPAGCPTGYTGAGGLADGGKYAGLGCTGGAHRAIDVAIFGLHHIYHVNIGDQVVSSATCSEDYLCDVFDPEGTLGFISAAWMTFLGLQAGRVFTNFRRALAAATPEGRRRAELRSAAVGAHVARWVVWGLLCGVIGGALCGFAQDGGYIPINKNLWSPSFVLCMASIAFLALCLFFVLIDVIGMWSGAPFVYPGMNSIVVYAGSEIFQGYFPFSASWNGDPESHAQALATHIAGVCCWLAIARVLYLKKIFVAL